MDNFKKDTKTPRKFKPDDPNSYPFVGCFCGNNEIQVTTLLFLQIEYFYPDELKLLAIEGENGVYHISGPRKTVSPNQVIHIIL